METVFEIPKGTLPVLGAAPAGELVFTKAAWEFKGDMQPDGYHIAGKASTASLDTGMDIVDPHFADAWWPEFMKHPLMLFMHDWMGMPIGRWDRIEVKEDHIHAAGTILPTSIGKDVMTLIDAGVLNSLSIGFNIEESTTDHKTGIRTINKGRVYEISVVNLGMNQEALFDRIKTGLSAHEFEIKSLNIITEGVPERTRLERKGTTMAIDTEMHDLSTKVDGLLKQFGDSLGEAKAQTEKVSSQVAQLDGQMAQRIKELKDGVASKEGFDAFVKQTQAELTKISEQVTLAKNVADIENRQIPMLGWKSKLHQYAGQSKMDLILRDRVDYKSHPEGELLKALRHQYDTAYMVKAYFQAKNPAYDWTRSTSWQDFATMLSYFAPEEFKAMAAANTGYGLEWVATGYSAEMHSLYEMQRRVETLIPAFNQPTETYVWPALASHGTAYPVAEATTNNPDTMRRSDWGTASRTFTAKTFGVAFSISAELPEDSIIAIAPVVQSELAWSMADAVDDALINGNDDATVSGDTWTNDLDTGYTTYALMKCKSLFCGLRLYASDRSATIDFASATPGVGDGSTAFAAKDVASLLLAMGKHADNPANVVFVMPLMVLLKIAFFTENLQTTYGGPGFYAGPDQLRYFMGSRMIVDPNYSTEMTTAGIYDGSTKTKTGMLAFNPIEFKIGNYRPITVEYQKDILTQQMAFVATARKSFKCMAPTTEDPVAAGYDIANTGL